MKANQKNSLKACNSNADLDHLYKVKIIARKTSDQEDIIESTNTKEVLNIISQLKRRKSSGPNGIFNETSKRFPDNAVEALTGMYDNILKFRYLPDRWEKATRKGQEIPKTQNH